jgi:O-antigen/teichoic acid export membrane protein
LNKAGQHIFSDFFWYLAGTVTTLLVGLLRTPVFTRYFTPEEYGYFSLILITYTLISIFLYGWLANCIWRFYNYYKKNADLNRFYLNLFLLYLVFSALFMIIAIFWFRLSAGAITKRLTILVFLQLFIASPLNYMLITDRLEYRSGKYNIITIIRVSLSFLIQYILTFQLNFRIEAIPLASLSVDIIILLIVAPAFLAKMTIKLKYISLKIIKTLFGYAIPGIISNVTAIVLASSDRYFIAWFGNIDQVGIYNQVYGFSQLSIVALVNVFFAVINPKFLKTLEYSFKGSNRLTVNYLVVFIIVILPLTFYLSLFSLFGREFRIGYKLMPWIMFGNFFYGLTLFSDNRLKFGTRYKQIVWGYLFTALLNIVLNYFFIPACSYRFAAISTLISYFILMLYFYYLDIRYNSLAISGTKVLVPCLIILFVQLLADSMIRRYLFPEIHLAGTLIESLIFTLFYVATVYLFVSKPVRIFFRTSGFS